MEHDLNAETPVDALNGYSRGRSGVMHAKWVWVRASVWLLGESKLGDEEAELASYGAQEIGE
jgi:hypothetical protein